MLQTIKYPFLIILSTSLLLPGCDLENNVNQATNPPEEETITETPDTSETSILVDNSQLNLQTSGQGIFELENREAVEITAVSFTMADDNTSEIIITLADNRTMEFAGETQQDNDSIITTLTNSGMADAEGYLIMQHQDNAITMLQGDGVLDSQAFSISFGENKYANPQENQPSEYIPFYQQQGRGIFTLEGRENENISSVMVQIDEDNKATIGISLSNDTIFNFRGEVSHQDAYTINIQLTSSGMADAEGLLKLEYGANNSINNLMANGKLDGQPFLINFSK
ncbi:hypothetical protein AA637_02520 [Cyanobacterium sp. HL-69]|uniref:hypothetical protein n=1 Tax=Cyanobacterium sp. HL-69 TaxID=2054282 RepID=UPI000CA0E972|nr:hypothetical protein AA637_02520 [Cyanobacterium sp. HL-69]